LLCKKLIPTPGYLVFFYDTTVARARNSLQNPHASAVFHWDAFGGQVRVEDSRRSPAEESDECFASRRLDSRIGAWASLQSQPLDARRTLLKSPPRLPASARTCRDRRTGAATGYGQSVELWIEAFPRA
jgi:pyridoxamine 5'-phosphate oxidase